MRFFLLAIGMVSISGCASSAWSDGGATSEVAPPLAGAPNFDWRLSGDRRVAPLQVFDDGRDVWLQFAPEQAVPAIFSGRGAGVRAVPYQRHPPYIVVPGQWAGLVFQGGTLRAYADRIAANAGAVQGGSAMPMAQASSALGASDHASLAHRPLVGQGPPVAGETSGRAVAAAEQSARAHSAAVSPDAGPRLPVSPYAVSPHAVRPASVAPDAKHRGGATAATPVGARFRIGPEDVTLRGGLTRWAGLAGWTFDPQHWAVDVDIPVAGTALFDGDFKEAVRALLTATELAERPVQPCFYSNKVLRVVPHARACQPRRDTGAAV